MGGEAMPLVVLRRRWPSGDTARHSPAAATLRRDKRGGIRYRTQAGDSIIEKRATARADQSTGTRCE
ncbi:hypothetical protein BHE74_00021777 [Ensete ventricosum]|nr:hypothetical protein GW17_00018040 [Ensete ventricosum]RWW70536.1 hypothetical protein BHE74_00021777 [Ensete ventricosum]